MLLTVKPGALILAPPRDAALTFWFNHIFSELELTCSIPVILNAEVIAYTEILVDALLPV
jgi:hypothetical protein